MQFKDGTSVYSLDGQHVGRVDRVVLNPKTKEVTDIVVRKGFLFTEDKTVPISLIASATVERVSLREDAGKLDELPPFEETHYIPLDEAEARKAGYPFDLATPLYWYPPMNRWMIGNSSGIGFGVPSRYRIETDQNIPEGTVALKEGARVFSADNQHVGNVAEVFTESPGNRVTSFLMSEGIFFKETKVIPVTWIREIQEEEIHLSVGTAILDKLQNDIVTNLF